MTAIKSPEQGCTVANPRNATAQLSLKQLAWRTLSDSCTVASTTNATAQQEAVAGVAAVARVAPVAGGAAVADRPVYDLRMALLALAERCGLDPTPIHRLRDADVAACRELRDAQLVTYLELLDDTAMRWVGKRPTGHDAAMLCHHCGPVWAHPGMAAVLPVVDGWPRALGCPWCAIRKAGGFIPRPTVQCMWCGCHQSNPTNPKAGMGQCARDKGWHYPTHRHACDEFKPCGRTIAPNQEPVP